MNRRSLELLVHRASKHFNLPFTIVDTKNGAYAALSLSLLTDMMLPLLLTEPTTPLQRRAHGRSLKPAAEKELLHFLGKKEEGYTRREIQTRFPQWPLFELRSSLKMLMRERRVACWGNTVRMHYRIPAK